MRILRRILSKVSEPYRIRNGFGLSPIRNNRELKALIEFCREELKEPYMELNPTVKAVFTQTVRLYDKQIVENDWSGCGDGDRNIHEFIRNHATFYWS